MILNRVAATLLALAAGISTVPAADVTVKMLHVEQNPQASGFWQEIARKYMAEHPGVKIELQLPRERSLQEEAHDAAAVARSSEHHLQLGRRRAARAGQGRRDRGPLGGHDAPTGANGSTRRRSRPTRWTARIYGVPMLISQVGFFYNKDLFAKAGVDAAAIKTWDDLLAAVKQLKAAGVTPIIVGGADKWPIHFYWTYLAMRNGGKPAFEAAVRGEGDGFAAAPFVKAGEQLRQLVDLEPFQPGFLGVTFPQSSGQFGDGKGAMELQGNFMLNSMRANSANKKGIPDDQLGWFPFPTTPGGKGDRLRHARRSQRLAGDEGLAEGGRRLPEVLLAPRAATRGGRARLLHSGGERDPGRPPESACCAASPRTSSARSTTRSSTIRCSGRPSAPWSTTSRPISRPR